MKITTFSAFKSYNYRLFFIGQSISLIGTWMQKTAVSWVVYSVTHSKFMLGVTLFATMFPSFLFSFIGGVASDRYNRHKLLIITQLASLIQALLMAIFVYFRPNSVWEILVLSVLLGIINAFDVPARQSLVYEMVNDKKTLPNALALNSSMVNMSRLIGPAIAGIAIEKLGETVCFGLNAVSFIAVIFSLLLMKLPKYVPKIKTTNVFEELKEGFIYLRDTRSIAFVIGMLGLMSLLVLPFATLIPVYAKDIFHGTASTFGLIDSAIGVGAFACALFLASLKPTSNYRKVLAICTFIFGLGLILFSHTYYYPLSLIFATVTAFGMMAQVTVSNTLIQTTVSQEMRGRVISFYAMAFFGLQPLGGLIIGVISQYVGVQNTIMAQGVIAVLIGLLQVRFIVANRKKEKISQLVYLPEVETKI